MALNEDTFYYKSWDAVQSHQTTCYLIIFYDWWFILEGSIFSKPTTITVRMVDEVDGTHNESGTVEANLLYAILGKLEDIRCQCIDTGTDIENAIDRN